MSKKQEAVGKYISEFARLIGTSLLLTSMIGLLLERPEIIDNLSTAIVFFFGGFSLVALGAVWIKHSTMEDK